MIRRLSICAALFVALWAHAGTDGISGLSGLSAISGSSAVVEAGPVFSWDFESATPTGSYSSLALEGGATRSDTSPLDGTYSLSIAATSFSQAQVYNWVTAGNKAFSPTDSFRIDFLFRYTGTWTVGVMLFQEDAKWTGNPAETNEGVSVITANTGSPSKKTVVVSALGTTFTPSSLDLQADTTYLFSLRGKKGATIDGFKSMQLLVDGVEKGYAVRDLDAAVASAWYHLSIGNDKVPTMAFWLDNFAIYDAPPAYVAPDPVVRISEGFEGTGLPSGWTAVSSTIDYDYSAAPITGSQSARMAFNATATTTFTAGDFVECYFKLKIETLPTNTAAIVALKTADDASILSSFRVTTSGAIQVGSATNSGSSTGTMSTGTVYHCWLSWQSGVFATAAFSTDGVRPRSGNNFVSLALGTTGQVGRLTLQRSQGIVCVLDDFQVNGTPIGDQASNFRRNWSRDMDGLALAY